VSSVLYLSPRDATPYPIAGCRYFAVTFSVPLLMLDKTLDLPTRFQTTRHANRPNSTIFWCPILIVFLGGDATREKI